MVEISFHVPPDITSVHLFSSWRTFSEITGLALYTPKIRAFQSVKKKLYFIEASPLITVHLYAELGGRVCCIKHRFTCDAAHVSKAFIMTSTTLCDVVTFPPTTAAFSSGSSSDHLGIIMRTGFRQPWEQTRP